MFFHEKNLKKKNLKIGSQFKIDSECLKSYKKWFFIIKSGFSIRGSGFQTSKNMFFHEKNLKKKNLKIGSQFKIDSECLKSYKKWFFSI